MTSDPPDNWDKFNQTIKEHEYILKLIISVIGIGATIIAAFLGAYLGTLGSENLWHKQIETQNKNLAHAFYLEIIDYEQGINSVSLDFNNAIHTPGSIVYMNSPIYGEFGLYYSFQKEIIVFSPELSYNLYNFYATLISAENDRKIIMENRQWILSHQENSTEVIWEIDKRTSQNKDLTIAIAHKLAQVNEHLPELKDQLKKEFSK